MSTEFDLDTQMRKLETIEEYFQKPDMDLAEAISRHKEALKIGATILSYLEKVESQVQEIDMSLIVKAADPVGE